MNQLWKLTTTAFKSALNRKVSLFLATFSIALSITLILAVDSIRREAKNNFTSTISGTDLIVGARGSSVNLLLYSVFRIGEVVPSLSYQAYLDMKKLENISWAVPLSLGDSHKGFRVMGTTTDYFNFYRYREEMPLEITEGKVFEDIYDTVIGSEVAKKLNYRIGDKIVIAHGLQAVKHSLHDDKPFTVSGILNSTGTPVDNTVHVSLEGLEAIHIDWITGAPGPMKINAEQARKFNLTPKKITAILLGTEEIIDIFHTQKKINDYKQEALMAILPGVTLANLWNSIGFVENLLLAISGLVLFSGMVGLITTLIATVNERLREIAILRSVGMFTYQVLILFAIETFLIVAWGCLIAIPFLLILELILQPIILNLWGLNLNLSGIYKEQILFLMLTTLSATLFSLIPGFIAYRNSIQNGLLLK